MEGKELWERVKHLKLDSFWVGLAAIIILFSMYSMNDKQITILSKIAQENYPFKDIHADPSPPDYRLIFLNTRLLEALGWDRNISLLESLKGIAIQTVQQSLILTLLMFLISCWMVFIIKDMKKIIALIIGIFVIFLIIHTLMLFLYLLLH